MATMPKSLKRNLRKIGGSLATTIPHEIAYILKLELGDQIEFYKNNGDVCIRKAKR
jgi:antitoxin component of MazEF toxin-antitoxin module